MERLGNTKAKHTAGDLVGEAFMTDDKKGCDYN